MIGKHENNRYYPEQCTQGSYYFNPEASEGEVVYIPEYLFDNNDFLNEGDEGMYTMNDLRASAQTRLKDIEGYADLSDERKSDELNRLVHGFIEWCGDGEAWCFPETYFAECDIEF
jgi:hypothetical protein